MTKRVLSLFLALVMALSLCVPAFAAEGDIAEAVESSEAGEPVAEAAVDEPSLTALGEVFKAARWKLQKAVDAADDFKAAVAAGSVYPGDVEELIEDFGKTLENYKKDQTENNPFKDVYKDYNKVLKAAEDLLAGTQDVDTKLDVVSSSVDKAADDLNVYVVDPSVKVEDHDGDYYLTDEIETAAMATALEGYFKDNSDQRAVASYKDKIPKATTTVTFDGKYNAAKDLAVAYQQNYIQALQAAVDQVVAFKGLGTKAKYADYKASVMAILNALILEETASKPNKDDAKKVADLLERAKKIANDANYDKTKYVQHKDANDLQNLIKKFDKLIADEYTQTVSFKDTATLLAVNNAIKELENALVPVNGYTIQVDKNTAEGGADSIAVQVSVKKMTTLDEDGDGNEYYYTYEVKSDGKTTYVDKDGKAADKAPSNGASKNEITKKVITELSSGSKWTSKDAPDGRVIVTGSLKNAEKDGTTPKFKTGDEVTVTFWVKKSEDADVFTKVGTGTIKVVDQVEPEVKATISEAKYSCGVQCAQETPAADQTPTITVTLKDKAVTGLSKYEKPVIRAVVAVGDGLASDASEVTSGKITGDITINLTGDNAKYDELLKAGTVKVKLQWASSKEMAGEKAWADISGATYDLTIPSITKWSLLEAAEEVVAECGDLKKSDFTVDPKNTSLEGSNAAEKLDGAFDLIKKNIGVINGIIGDSSKGSTAANHNAVLNAVDDLGTVVEYLVALDSTKEMNEWRELVEEVEKLLADDYTETDQGAGVYTFDSLGKLSDVLTDYKDALEGEDTILKSWVQEAIDAVTAAKKALVKIGEINKSELEASIKAAKDLKEEDYTEESWKAADLANAIKEAEAVLANEKATQAQLSAAAKKLNDAVAKLVKKPGVDPSDIPEKPTYGEHWAKGKSGNWYYLVDGKAVKNTWVMSTRGIWYYMDENGVMVTGVHNCVSTKGHYDEKTGKYNEKTTWSAGLYYFQQKGEAVPGRVFGGKWVKDANYGDVWAHGQHDGYYGKVEWTKKAGPITNWKN